MFKILLGIMCRIVFGGISIVFLAACAPAPTVTPAPIATFAPTSAPLPTAAMALPTPHSWVLLPDLPSTATQADVGAEIYRLVCQDCHGNRGQGLTAEWLAQWAPEDQNCWQSKCHAPNHPPDGFTLPSYVPPLIGPGTLSQFKTAFDLYNYIRITMPWYSPGSLQETEYWQLTAFLAREHHVALGNLPLDENRAKNLLLSP
jgi:cytochrome c5